MRTHRDMRSMHEHYAIFCVVVKQMELNIAAM